jgi:two-component system chemotaxis sensor kinase CheA
MVKTPSSSDIEELNKKMYKSREDMLNCGSCGYNNCEQMAVAIFNGLNKPENCRQFIITHLAERDEIAAMKDSLNIGLFFMDKDFIIQDNYSKAMCSILGGEDFNGVKFSDIIADSVTPDELHSIEDYFAMLFNPQFGQSMLNDINPLNELCYTNKITKTQQILHVDFVPVEREHGEIMVMVSIYDITTKIELRKKLAEKEKLRQEEMRSLFELINLGPRLFKDFIEDAEYEFKLLSSILRNHELSAQDALNETYQSIHTIKSNAVILGLTTFGNKVETVETRIKEMQEMGSVPFDDMLKLTLDIEGLYKEKESFREAISRIDSFKSGAKQKSNRDVFVETLIRVADNTLADWHKKARLVVETIEDDILDLGPRRIMKETLMQLVSNSVIHGIEDPEDRIAIGKEDTGNIYLSIKRENNMIHIRLKDDGEGINFKKIRRKALANGVVTETEANDKNKLLQAMFLPGFSASRSVQSGRGIGLNFVRDRIKEMGGFIKIQTEQDKGTVFHLYIPFRIDAPNEQAQRTAVS